MPEASYSTARRSQRLFHGLPVVVCGENPKAKPFREEALTVAFNAHGALLVLYAKVEMGQQLLLMNPTTWDEQEGCVVYSTPSFGGLTHVGVQFKRPSPQFWPIGNPPEDWKMPLGAA
jgi:hypothetical protein